MNFFSLLSSILFCLDWISEPKSDGAEKGFRDRSGLIRILLNSLGVEQSDDPDSDRLELVFETAVGVAAALLMLGVGLWICFRIARRICKFCCRSPTQFLYRSKVSKAENKNTLNKEKKKN